MKQALLAALCFIAVSLVLVNGTFALPEFDEVFQAVEDLLENGIPKPGGEGTAVHVGLVSDEEPQKLFPGSAVSQVTHVENLGEGEVYFRLVYAVQYDAESWDHLTIRFDAGEGFIEHDWQDITSSGTPYKMKVFTYDRALPIGADSPDVTISIAMDTAVTSQQLSRYRNDFLKMQVLAIDPTPFIEGGYATAEAALNAALPLDRLSPF